MNDSCFINSISALNASNRAYEQNPILVRIFLFVSIINNVIIVIGVMAKKALRKPMYHLIANLAISDILTACSFLTTSFTSSHSSSMPCLARKIICKVFRAFMMNLALVQSMQTLAILSIERYNAVVRPTKKITNKKAHILSALSWLLAAGITWPFLITADYFNGQCLNTQDGSVALVVMNVLLVIMEFVVPIIIMIALYGIVIYHLNIKKSVLRNESAKIKKLKRKTTYMLVVTTGAFMLCMLPWALSLTVKAAIGRSSTQINDALISRLLVQMGEVTIALSIIYNPIVYCIFNRPIRELYFSWSCTFCNTWIPKNTVTSSSSTAKIPEEPISTHTAARSITSNRYRIIPQNILLTSRQTSIEN